MQMVDLLQQSLVWLLQQSFQELDQSQSGKSQSLGEIIKRHWSVVSNAFFLTQQ